MIRELNVEGHKNKVKIENTLGMFDLLKGVVMFIMVLFHNRSVFPELVMDRAVATTEKATVKFLGYGYELAVFARIVFSVVVSFGISLMPALMVLGGYGFRKRKISKALSGLTVEILIPYIFTMVVTTVAHFFLHYAFFNYFRGAVEESFKVLGGMMLGLSQTSSFGSVVLFANGPIWYLLATFWSLFTFDIVLNIANERHVVFYVGGISIAGWLLSYIKYVPWCLSQGLVGVAFVYIGYRLKKSKFYSKEHSVKEKSIYILLVFIPSIVLCFFGLIIEMADNVYSLGPVSIIESGLFSILLIYLFLRINTLRGPISGSFRIAGRYSLYVMCVHTVEMIAIPWYAVKEYLHMSPLLGFFVVYFARIIIIAFGVFIVIKVSSLKKLLKEKIKLNKKEA